MSKNSKPTKKLIENNADVKAFIYQQIVEFESFVTPDTKITVVARNPRRLMPQFENPADAEYLKSSHRIAVVLVEDGASIEAEGVHPNIFTAITMAKENLMIKLLEIQESVVSSQERQMAINQALQNNMIH